MALLADLAVVWCHAHNQQCSTVRSTSAVVLQGTWHAELCTCVCLNTANNSLPGFCPDATTGACTAVKTYDLASRTWNCPGVSAGQGDPMGSSSNVASGSGAGSATPSPAVASSTAPVQVPASTAPSTPTTSSAVGGSTLGSQSPAAGSLPTTPAEVADVQPLAGVQFPLVLKGELSSFVPKAQAVCTALAALAGEAPATCSIASASETAAPIGTATRRLASTGTQCSGGQEGCTTVSWTAPDAWHAVGKVA